MLNEACTVELTRDEVQQLSVWHRECEMRFVEMRKYEHAQREKERCSVFDSLLKSGNRVWKESADG